MVEILPDDSIEGYSAYCPKCKKTIKTNMQGSEIGNHICINKKWYCNECNFSDYTDSIHEEDLYKWLQCSNCGGNEFHLK